MTRKLIDLSQKAPAPATRRKFLKAATGAAAAGATLGFPMIAKGQTTPTTMRFQSTWPTKDIFSRVRTGLRQDRQRHDGWRTED
jgi:hypothetical protein